MGLFDGVFNTGPQNAAANAQVSGIQSGLQGLQGAFQQGQADLTGWGQGGINQLQASGNQGIQGLQTNYTAGLQPYMQNFQQAQQGTGALGNALGLNGAAGNAAATQAFQNNPGYQFQLQQGLAAANAAAQAGGMGNSGNALLAAQQYGQGLANTTYQQYVQNLQPYLGASQNAAAGIGGLYSGLGSGINQNALTTGAGVAGQAQNLGNQLLASQTNLGNAIYGANSSIGNAYANAQLAQGGANANGLNAIMNTGKALAQISDMWAKDEIEPVGELYDGQRIYRYKYRDGDPRHHIGLIAQEVEQVEPGAVHDMDGRFKGVNYKAATDYAAELARLVA